MSRSIFMESINEREEEKPKVEKQTIIHEIKDNKSTEKKEQQQSLLEVKFVIYLILYLSDELRSLSGKSGIKIKAFFFRG